jgi:hypothetical protein
VDEGAVGEGTGIDVSRTRKRAVKMWLRGSEVQEAAA